MKRLSTLHLVRASVSLLTPAHYLLLLTWVEQIGVWLLTVNWDKLPFAFAGATIATLKSKKDAAGQVIHKPFWEWITIALGGTIIGMTAWKDILNFTKLTPEFSTLIAGLVGWLLADIILKQAKNQLMDNSSTPKP